MSITHIAFSSNRKTTIISDFCFLPLCQEPTFVCPNPSSTYCTKGAFLLGSEITAGNVENCRPSPSILDPFPGHDPRVVIQYFTETEVQGRSKWDYLGYVPPIPKSGKMFLSPFSNSFPGLKTRIRSFLRTSRCKQYAVLPQAKSQLTLSALPACEQTMRMPFLPPSPME